MIEAAWTIELNATCPACDDDVDLLDYPDFWEDHTFDLAEHGTDRTSGVKVGCPACGNRFLVDLEY